METNLPKKCESSDHYTNLIIWGECHHCKRVWGLSSEEDASETYPEFRNTGKVVTKEESELPF